MGVDKRSLRIDGETLLARAVRRLRDVADPIVIAAGSAVPIDGVVCVDDATPGKGPLGGVVAALRASPHRLTAIVAVDMPDLDPWLLRALAASWGGEDAVVPLSDGGPEPLHAVYASSSLPTATTVLGGDDVSMRSLLNALIVRYVDVAALYGDDAARRFARNLNAPEDVTAWRSSR